MPKTLLFIIYVLLGTNIISAQDNLLAANISEYSYQQNEQEEVTLISALADLSEKYDVYFSYDVSILNGYRIAKSSLTNTDVEAALKNLLRQTALKYKKIGAKNYVIYQPVSKAKISTKSNKSSQSKPLSPSKSESTSLAPRKDKAIETRLLNTTIAVNSTPENVTVKGTIIDETEQPMIGVTVFIKENTGLGTTTDFDGNFSLNLPDLNQTLIISYVGYQTQEFVLKGQNNLSIQLQPDLQTLDEVVIVGFGTQKKRFTTGAISKVGSEELENLAQTTVESSLQGKIAGVQVTTSDAMAGSPVTIRIRGTSSIVASSEPLYVVDGIPVVTGNFSHNSASSWRLATAHDSNALSQLNPADIESIEILKDAAAAAIYGSRGANGVVLITTKRGKQGKTKFDVNFQTGFSKETNRIEMLNGADYITLAKEAWSNSNDDAQLDDNPRNDNRFSTANDFEKMWQALLPTGLTKEVALQTNTDWIDFALQEGHFQEMSLAASGGTAKTTFYIGGTYRDEQGIFVGNNFKRYNARVNLDHKPTDNLSIGTRIAYTVTDNDIIPISWAGGLGTAQSQSLPFWPVFNEDGTYFNAQSGNNVAAELANTEMNQKGTSILGNVYGQWNFLKNFSVRSEFGINNIYKKERYYRSAIIEPTALATAVLSESINWNINNTLSYSNTFGKHAIDLLAGMNATKNEYFTNIINGEEFPNPALKNPENAAIRTTTVGTTQFSFLSFLGRLNYRFNEKYLLGASIRRDGSSRFGRGNRWGVFPAVSLGWIVSDEPFLADSPTLTFLKFRASYGQTGNAEIGNFEYFGAFSTSNYIDNPGIVVQEIDNDNLGWEANVQYDIGLDFGLWDGRIEGGIDFYLKETTDLLTEIDVSSLSGVERVTSNVGSLENKGFDFSLTSHNLTGKFKWQTNFNVGYNTNEITDLGGRPFIPGQGFGLGAIGVGFPVGARFTVPFVGIAANDFTTTVTNPETNTQSEITIRGGDEIFLNQFGEQTNIYDPNDQVFIGNPNPVWSGGITNSFSFKNFDVSVLITFATGHDLSNDEQRFQFNGFGYGWNMWSSALNRWQSPGDLTDMHRLTWAAPRNNTSSRVFYDASYARLKDITIGYNLPKRLTQKWQIGSMRVFAKGTNLATFTSYPGWDPEYNRDGAGNVGQGKSWLPSPQAKNVSFGVNVSF